jgi:hypothetical protein
MRDPAQTRLPSGHSDALDRLRAQLDEAQSRLERARVADDQRQIGHWEAIIERIVARGRELPQGGAGGADPSPKPAKPPDMSGFIRGQLLGG